MKKATNKIANAVFVDKAAIEEVTKELISLGDNVPNNKELKLLEELGYTIDLTELSLENKKIKLYKSY